MFSEHYAQVVKFDRWANNLAMVGLSRYFPCFQGFSVVRLGSVGAGAWIVRGVVCLFQTQAKMGFAIAGKGVIFGLCPYQNG
jgi:hypothetical protein